MSFISFSQKNIELSVFSIIIFITTLISQMTNINSAPLNIAEIDNNNKTIYRYHQAVINFNGFSKKMEKITLNVYLRALFRELIRDYEDLKTEMLKLKTNQEKNESISNNINNVEKSLKTFEKNYKNINNTYKRFDDTKKLLLQMFKIFIIVLSVIIFIALIAIGIGSYFVINYQKKYSKLHEEQSIRIGQNEYLEKVKNTSGDEKEKKIIYAMKSTQEPIQSTKDYGSNNPVIIEPHNPISKDDLNNKTE